MYATFVILTGTVHSKCASPPGLRARRADGSRQDDNRVRGERRADGSRQDDKPSARGAVSGVFCPSEQMIAKLDGHRLSVFGVRYICHPDGNRPLYGRVTTRCTLRRVDGSRQDDKCSVHQKRLAGDHQVLRSFVHLGKMHHSPLPSRSICHPDGTRPLYEAYTEW